MDRGRQLHRAAVSGHRRPRDPDQRPAGVPASRAGPGLLAGVADDGTGRRRVVDGTSSCPRRPASTARACTRRCSRSASSTTRTGWLPGLGRVRRLGLQPRRAGDRQPAADGVLRHPVAGGAATRPQPPQHRRLVPAERDAPALHDRITVLDDVTQAMFLATKLADPTRPVLDAVGYSHRVAETDVWDSHDYEQDPDLVRRPSHTGLADGRRSSTTTTGGRLGALRGPAVLRVGVRRHLVGPGRLATRRAGCGTSPGATATGSRDEEELLHPLRRSDRRPPRRSRHVRVLLHPADRCVPGVERDLPVQPFATSWMWNGSARLSSARRRNELQARIMTFTTSTLPSQTDGLTLTTYAWEGVSQPKAVVQISHGLAEHAGRYDRLATALNGAGYLVYAHDHPGHGATGEAAGSLGVVRGGGLDRAGRRRGHRRPVGRRAAARSAAVPDRPLDGLVRLAAGDRGPLRAVDRRGAVRHHRARPAAAGHGGSRRRGERRPERLQRRLRAPDRLRVVEPRRGRGGPLRRRPVVRLRGLAGRDAADVQLGEPAGRRGRAGRHPQGPADPGRFRGRGPARRRWRPGRGGGPALSRRRASPT